MSGEAPTPENTKSDDEGYSDDGFDDDVDPASPAASPEPTLLSIAAFIKGSQECAPTSPRTLEACFTQVSHGSAVTGEYSRWVARASIRKTS